MPKTSNKTFAYNLEKRTKQFAVSAIKIASMIPKTVEGNVIKNQLTKSGTSIGANYREANRARSKADFRNKIKICESEASETQYWLEIVMESKMLTEADVINYHKESSELLAIFTTIAKSTKALNFSSLKSL